MKSLWETIRSFPRRRREEERKTIWAQREDPLAGICQEAPLLALARDEIQAEEIAALYGIQLVQFSFGCASYYTQENPREVIRRGEEKGWPRLSLNHTYRVWEPNQKDTHF